MWQGLRDVISNYDFSAVGLLDADKLVRFPEIMPVLVKWFGEDPGDFPPMPVPADVQDHEFNYITELLAAYSERSGTVLTAAADALAHATHGRHLRDQRTRYFEASAFSRYYRDNTPPGTVEDFEQQIYHGVIDESRLVTTNDALDRVDRILKHASSSLSTAASASTLGSLSSKGPATILLTRGIFGGRNDKSIACSTTAHVQQRR